MIDITDDEFQQYLYETLVAVDSSDRVVGHWIMNADWYNRLAVLQRNLPNNAWDGIGLMGYSIRITEEAEIPEFVCAVNPDL